MYFVVIEIKKKTLLKKIYILLLVTTKKSILKSKTYLIRFSHDSVKVIFSFSSYVLTEGEKSLLWKGLRFCIPPKKIEYADFLTQFELLYGDNIMFEMK